MAMRISGCAPDQSHDLSRLGVASERLVGKNEAPVHRHVEHPARGFNETNLSIGNGVFQLSRQTGGSGLIVSNDAVLDRDEHGSVPRGFLRVSPANRSG